MTMRTSSDDDPQREADAASARELVARIYADVARVRDHYQRLDDAGPMFLRYIWLTAIFELGGDDLRAALDDDPDRAGPWAREIVMRLEAYIYPPTSPSHTAGTKQ
jgi:hypothetical protein